MRLERLGLVPDLALGTGYLVAWAVPGLIGAGSASWLVLGIELEALALFGAFVLAVSLIATLDKTAELKVRLTGAAVGLGAVGFALVQVVRFGFWGPALVLGGLLANRVAGFVTGELSSEEGRVQLLVDAVLTTGLYVFAVGPTFYLEVPALGANVGPLPPEHARWCAFPGELVSDFFESPTTGDWCAEPHRALAGGALYFFASAFRAARRARRAKRKR